MGKDDTAELLLRLFEIVSISRKGYEDAADHVEKPVLQTRFYQFAQQRIVFSEQLEEMIRRYGHSVDEAGSFGGSMMKAWIDFKSGFLGHDTKGIIDQCLKEEETTLIEYQNALKEELPDDIKPTISEQHQEIVKVFENLKEFQAEY